MSSFAQTCAAGATQEPLLQVLWPTRLVPEQVAEAQTLVGKLHAPLDPQAPAQIPVPPQEGWLLCGVALGARFVQVPWNPGMSHATQAPAQAVLQQIPSGEQVVPETHRPGTVLQACPCLLLQAPLASQVPRHRPFGSSWFVAATQAWLELHIVQFPEQSLFVQQADGEMHVVVPLTVHDLELPVEGQL
jgi:hypothetical protein